MQKKDGFSSKIGFVLAAAGSAVGLGNIWRFPYLTAKYGGGIFLLTYLILVLTFGYALLIAENAIGRMTGKGPIGAFRELCEGKRAFFGCVKYGGWINSIVPMIIIPYYCVIGGWVTKYVFAMLFNPIISFNKDMFESIADKNVPASAAYFQDFIASSLGSISFFLLFMLIIVVVAAFGVEKGVERFNKILMPILILLIIGICIYCMFLPNAAAGFRYYLMPDPSKFSYRTVVAAMGQLFFSLSIAMGIMITYGAYMRKEDNLISSVNQVELFDTGVAFLAGLMIIPSVVAFGGEKAAENAGVGLVFITMPQVFAEFPGGKIVGVAFFIIVLFAAATSAISLLETNVHTLCQELKINRTKAIMLNVVEILIIGKITILGYSVLSHVKPLKFIAKYSNMDILDTLDFISNSVLMPIGAIFTTVLVIGVIGMERICREIRGDNKWYREWVFQFCMCVIVIPCLLIVLLNATGLI